jgi:hypothetical protein
LYYFIAHKLGEGEIGRGEGGEKIKLEIGVIYAYDF